MFVVCFRSPATNSRVASKEHNQLMLHVRLVYSLVFITLWCVPPPLGPPHAELQAALKLVCRVTGLIYNH